MVLPSLSKALSVREGTLKILQMKCKIFGDVLKML